MGVLSLPDLVAELDFSALSSAALVCALGSNLFECLVEPITLAEISKRCDLPSSVLEPTIDVLIAFGLVRRDDALFYATPELRQYLVPSVLRFLHSKLRASHHQATHLIETISRRESPARGWSHDDVDYLCDIGTLSATFVSVLANEIFPKMEGLEERLASPAASVLEVGTGVGALTVQMQRRWPNARLVGLEVLPQAYAIAEANLEEEALADRVELRLSSVLDLQDTDNFDVAWLPLAFFERRLITPAMQKVFAALRPGGWVVTSVVAVRGNGLRPSLLRLTGALWGGHTLYDSEAAELLRQSGYVQVMSIPMAPDVQPVIVGRRPLNAP